MGTPHTLTQHLNLLNREPGLNCFTLPVNQGALHFSTGWRRRGRINQAWDTSLLSRCTHSSVSKDCKDLKSASTYLLLLTSYVFLVWPDSSFVFGFMFVILSQKLLWCTWRFQVLKLCFKTNILEGKKRSTWLPKWGLWLVTLGKFPLKPRPENLV